jgi:putative membrane protein
MMANGWYGWWHMSFMWIFWIALAALVIWVIVRAASGAHTGVTQDSPEQILKRRYARGEIAKEEYEQRLSNLRR